MQGLQYRDPQLLAITSITVTEGSFTEVQEHTIMITRCANLDCQEELHYLRSGRIIAVDIRTPESTRVEHFWLCGKCSEVLDFDCMQEGHMRLRTKSVPDAPCPDSSRPDAMRKPPSAELAHPARIRRC